MRQSDAKKINREAENSITTSASLRSASSPFLDHAGGRRSLYPPSELGVGQEVTLTEWSQRLDGPGGQLLLRGGVGVAELHARAARIARVISRAEGLSQPALPDPDDTLLTGGMLLTDGHTSYHCTLLQAEHLLLVFHGRSPAPGDTLRIVRLDGPQMPETEQVASPLRIRLSSACRGRPDRNTERARARGNLARGRSCPDA